MNLQRRILAVLFLFLAGVPPIFMWLAYRNGGQCINNGWDQAFHALDALKLYNNLITASFASLWMNLMAMTHWPPMPAVLMAPFYLFLPKELAPPVFALVTAFLSLAIPGWLLGRGTLSPTFRQSVVAYVVFLSLAAVCPLLNTYAVASMVEVPGLLLTILAVMFYCRALESREAGDFEEFVTRHYRWASLSLLGVCLTKWNFGIQLILMVAVAEFLVTDSQTKRLWWQRWIVPFLSWKCLPLFNVLAMLPLGIMVWIKVTGGGTFSFLGVRVSATWYSNPIYYLFVILCLKAFIFWWQRRNRWTELPAYQRLLVTHALFPYALWLLYPIPNRFHSLLYHLNYRSSDIPKLSWANTQMTYDFLITDFFISHWHLGLVAALLLVGFFVPLHKKQWSLRFLLGYCLFCVISTTYFTSNRGNRFFLNFLPLLFLAAGVVIAALSKIWLKVIAIGILAVGFFLGWPKAAQEFTTPQLIRSFGTCSDPAFRKLLREKFLSRMDGDRRTTIVGALALNNPTAPELELEFNQQFPDFSDWPKPPLTDKGYQIKDSDFLERELRANNLRWLLLIEPNEPLVETDERLICRHLADGHVPMASTHLSEVSPDGKHRITLYGW